MVTEKIEIKPCKKERHSNLVEVKMTITRGKLLTIINGLQFRKDQGSPVAEDVLCMIERTCQENGIETT